MADLYKESGVDIEKGYESVKRITSHINRTKNDNVLTQIGGFAGAFSISDFNMKNPVLVSGTDGVGTKVILAQQANRHDTIGIDCVAMCVNDVLASGAKPLFFLDYLALGKNKPELVEEIVAGVAEGCVQSDMALIGGETAEMPDMYAEDEYDLAGFTVGIVDQDKLFNQDKVQSEDILIALPSSGIHSNGYSLVRKLFFKDNNYSFDYKLENGHFLIDELLKPTRIYTQDVLPLIEKDLVNGIAHITGGGFYENLPRLYSDQLAAEIYTDVIPPFEIFKLIQELGNISTKEMYSTFNMGVGLVLAVSPKNVNQVLDQVNDAFVLGKLTDKNDEDLILSESKG